MMRDLARGAWRLATGPKLERQVVVAGLRMLPRVTQSLADRGYSGTREWLLAMPAPDFESRVPSHTLMRADKAIRLVHRRSKCLERSLTVWWLAGEGATIQLGVAPPDENSGHRFHAWVERDGVVVNDPPQVLDVFTPLVGHAAESADPGMFD